MKTKYFAQNFFIGITVGVSLILTQGCATNKTPWYSYFQRAPIRVVVMPSGNKTEHPDAPVIFNKACEEALTKNNFVVISADKVVTYASSRGVLLSNLSKLKASEIGKDLKADMVLYSEIDTWESKYVVLNTKVHVAGTSRMIETTTDAVVWHYKWDFQKDSSNGNNNGILGLLISAAVDAVVNSAVDACGNLGNEAGGQTVNTLPTPGFAPDGLRPLPQHPAG